VCIWWHEFGKIWAWPWSNISLSNSVFFCGVLWEALLLYFFLLLNIGGITWSDGDRDQESEEGASATRIIFRTCNDKCFKFLSTLDVIPNFGELRDHKSLRPHTNLSVATIFIFIYLFSSSRFVHMVITYHFLYMYNLINYIQIHTM